MSQDSRDIQMTPETAKYGKGSSLELLTLPSRDEPALRICKHSIVLGPQEICDRIAVFGGVKWHNAMDAGLKSVTACKAQ